MINWIIEWLTYINEIDLNNCTTFDVVFFLVTTYSVVEWYVKARKRADEKALVEDLEKDNDFVWTFFYENGSQEQFRINRSIFYETMLGRGFLKRIDQDYPEYKVVTPYDTRTYNINFNKDLLNTHNVTFSYPEYFEYYINLKQQLIYGQLYSIWLKAKLEDKDVKLDWYYLPKIVYNPPVINVPNSTYWTSQAESLFIISNFSAPIDLLYMWLSIFSFISIIFFFKIYNFENCKKFIFNILK